MSVDPALQPLLEINHRIWQGFQRGLEDLTQEEVDWRPLPQANNINVIVRHLRIEGEWHLACLERGEAMPFDVTPELQRRIDAVPLDFEKNRREFEALFTRFLGVLETITEAELMQRSRAAYREWRKEIPPHQLGFHQALHLTGHLGQISTIRNLYRKTRGEEARFFPDNPTYPKA